MIVCLNGKLLREDKAYISIHDHGFLYGDGLYETMRARAGQILFVNDHLKRLMRGCRRLRLVAHWNNVQLTRLIQQTLRANKLKDAIVRVTLTRGPGPHGFDPRPCKTPTLLITARAFHGYDSIRARGGMTLALVNVRRNAPNSTPPDVKSLSCLNGVLAKIESLTMNADEALLLGEQGHVAEGSVSNIFLVRKGVLITPRLDGNQLPGVTRAAVIRLARRLHIAVKEKLVTPKDLIAADEIFLTNALMDIMPVRALIWGRPRRRKLFTPGSVAHRLLEDFLKLIV